MLLIAVVILIIASCDYCDYHARIPPEVPGCETDPSAAAHLWNRISAAIEHFPCLKFRVSHSNEQLREPRDSIYS